MTFRIRWAWFIPVLFIYRPGKILGFSAYNFGLVVVSDSACQESASLPDHEIVHTKQVLATLGLHCIFYYASRQYRYWAELMAYRASIRAGLALEVAAAIMETSYGFKKSKVEIISDLQGGIWK